eukprot:1154959-Pelagomonas_calceolata.AAC.1
MQWYARRVTIARILMVWLSIRPARYSAQGWQQNPAPGLWRPRNHESWVPIGKIPVQSGCMQIILPVKNRTSKTFKAEKIAH